MKKERGFWRISGERGQALLIIALAFIGLVAFIGLALDAGILFSQIGHLRRGVDTAALSAANQIRKGHDRADLESSARELVLLNLPGTDADMDVAVHTCDTPDLVQGCDAASPRKLARVEASLKVDFVFLPIIGWDSVRIRADAISETASIDLILVIDTSTSMAYDFPGSDASPEEIDQCIADHTCQPFEKVREAAKLLVDQMYVKYDRVGLVTFDRFAGLVDGTPGKASERPLTRPDQFLTHDKGAIISALDAMEVYPPPSYGDLCPGWGKNEDEDGDLAGDPRGCMPTNTAAGLMLAGKEFLDNPRDEALRVVVLLSDGVANAAYAVKGFAPLHNPLVADDWYCPTDYWRKPYSNPPVRVSEGLSAPFCTDGDPYRGYVNSWGAIPSDGDPEDAARFWADWVGCLPGGSTCLNKGLGSVIFTIGLGDQTTQFSDAPHQDAGEQLLRYIANVGYNGDPSMDSSSNPCILTSGDPIPSETHCGNYFYAPDGGALNEIFAAIADRIFTRLTH
jgi:hypothetical protein